MTVDPLHATLPLCLHVCVSLRLLLSVVVAVALIYLTSHSQRYLHKKEIKQWLANPVW